MIPRASETTAVVMVGEMAMLREESERVEAALKVRLTEWLGAF